MAVRCSRRLPLSAWLVLDQWESPVTLPWATTPDISFLVTLDELRSDLLASGFQIVRLRDTPPTWLLARLQSSSHCSGPPAYSWLEAGSLGNSENRLSG